MISQLCGNLCFMATEQIVALLIQERDKLDRAISALGGSGGGKRRGRPAKNPMATTLELACEKISVAGAQKKRGWTAAQKKAQKERSEGTHEGVLGQEAESEIEP
jgi:hypothetical protein